ncbi:MAG: hypothetical protein LQ339_008260 [Xanthoria mediterranea]|nr:MAG: hypothetical protein LQ339_008260 [Xanthoria mediterranea]
MQTMSPILHEDQRHGPSSKPGLKPNTMPPLSLEVDSLATGDMKIICEIDPSDNNRFLYGCALPGWSKYESYAFADLPLLLNRPGPPFYAVGKDRKVTQESTVCRINPHDKSLFMHQGWEGTLTSYPIADIPTLITSTGAPFYIPLKNKTSLKPNPGFEGSSFCREGHHSAGMGSKHRDRSISASSCDEADEYSDFRANLNNASFRSLERMLGLPPTDFAYDAFHFADKPDGFEGFQTFPASPGISAGDPIPEVQEASFAGDDSFEISFQYPDDIIPASQPDKIDGFVGCSRPLSRCRNYGDCMLQASARTSERPLGLPATAVHDRAQPVSNCPQHSIPTVSSGSDSRQHTPHRRNNGRHPNGYYIPQPDRILSTDESMSSYFRTHNASRIDNGTGLHRHHSDLSHEQSQKEIKPLSYRFCIDLSGIDSWLPSPEEKEALLASSRCSATDRALLLPRAQGQKPTAANGHALYDFHKNLLEAHHDPVEIHAPHKTGFFSSMDMQGGCGMFAAPMKHGTYQRADLDEKFREYGFKTRHEMASCGDDVEKCYTTFVDKDAYDAKYNPSYRPRNRFPAKRMMGKKIRSMVFWIVVAIFGLGMWLDSMHATDLVDRGEGKVEFGGGEGDGVWGLRDGGEGVEVFPQLDPAAPDLGELGGGGASGGKE